MTEPTNVWDVHCEPAEGPVWVGGALWFVDIKKQQVHRYDPATGAKRSWDAPEQIGFIVPEEGGAFVAALQPGDERPALLRHDEADLLRRVPAPLRPRRRVVAVHLLFLDIDEPERPADPHRPFRGLAVNVPDVARPAHLTAIPRR